MKLGVLVRHRLPIEWEHFSNVRRREGQHQGIKFQEDTLERLRGLFLFIKMRGSQRVEGSKFRVGIYLFLIQSQTLKALKYLITECQL